MMNDTPNQPVFTLDKPEYIAAVVAFGRNEVLGMLHRLGVKQGKVRRSDEELAELLWFATAPTRERNRAIWEAATPKPTHV